MSADLIIDILWPPVLVMVLAILVLVVDRATSEGRPMTPHMRDTLIYGSVFLLGASYAMSLASALQLPDAVMYGLIVVWGLAVLAFAASRRRRRA